MASESNRAASMKYNSSNGTTSLNGGNTREIATTPNWLQINEHLTIIRVLQHFQVNLSAFNNSLDTQSIYSAYINSIPNQRKSATLNYNAVQYCHAINSLITETL